MEGGVPDVEQMMAQQQAQAANEERRVMILDQILEPAAKERMTRLALVKKDKARMVEDALINAASSGKIQKKVSEEDLIAMLEKQFGDDSDAGNAVPKKKVVIQRRKYFEDDDDDDNDDDLM